jgi:hypothetical protein
MKEARKKLQAEIIAAIENTLSQQSQSIAGKMKVHVRDAGKMLSKKFFKTVKAVAKAAAKENGKAKAKSKPARRAKAAPAKSTAKPARGRRKK